VNETRTPFPLSGGFISFSSFHTSASCTSCLRIAIIVIAYYDPFVAAAVAAVSFNSNPQSLTNFNTTSSGQTYPLLLPTFSTSVEGTFCVHVNVSSLGVSGVTNGTLATILMVYNGGDGILHQVQVTSTMSNRLLI
jgi:hypothetical protein